MSDYTRKDLTDMTTAMVLAAIHADGKRPEDITADEMAAYVASAVADLKLSFDVTGSRLIG